MDTLSPYIENRSREWVGLNVKNISNEFTKCEICPTLLIHLYHKKCLVGLFIRDISQCTPGKMYSTSYVIDIKKSDMSSKT